MPKRRGAGELPRIFQRASDKLWIARVAVGRKAGAVVYETFAARSRDEAARKRAVRIAELAEAPGSRAAGRTQTVGPFFRRWLETIAPPARSPATYRVRLYHVDKYVEPVLGGVLLRALGADDLIRLYWSVSDRTSIPRALHTTIRLGLAAAKRWGEVARNVADDVSGDRPRYAPPEVRSPDAEVVAAFLARAKDTADPLYCWWLLAVYGGFRPCELHGFEWRDVDWTKRTLSVRRRRSTVGAPDLSVGAKTAAGVRTVALPAWVLEALRAHRRHQTASTGTAQTLVFCDGAGRPLRGYVPREAFTALAEAVGLEGRPYDLRHFHATELLRQGVPELVIARRLGHASTRILRVYAHADMPMDAAAADVFDRVMAPPPPAGEQTAE